MNKIKKYLNFEINSSIIMLVIGLGLLLFPEFFTATVCYILGALAIAFSISSVIKYVVSPITFFPLGYAIILFVIGIVLIVRHDSVISILPFVSGVFLLVNSIKEIMRALDYKKNYGQGWVSLLIPSLIMLVLGVILMAFPFGSVMLMLRIVGAALVYSAIENIFHINYIKRRIDKSEPIEGSFSDSNQE